MFKAEKKSLLDSSTYSKFIISYFKLDRKFKWIFLSHFKSRTVDPFSVYLSSTRHKLFPEVLHDQTMVMLFLSSYCIHMKTKKWTECEMHLLTVFLSAFIRGECLSLSPCSVACPTTHGLLFSWTLQTLYRSLLIGAGEATRNSAERHCSSWLGNSDTQHLNEQQQLLSYINLRFFYSFQMWLWFLIIFLTGLLFQGWSAMWLELIAGNTINGLTNLSAFWIQS